jgi:hypothetical protein
MGHALGFWQQISMWPSLGRLSSVAIGGASAARVCHSSPAPCADYRDSRFWRSFSDGCTDSCRVRSVHVRIELTSLHYRRPKKPARGLHLALGFVGVQLRRAWCPRKAICASCTRQRLLRYLRRTDPDHQGRDAALTMIIRRTRSASALGTQLVRSCGLKRAQGRLPWRVHSTRAGRGEP